MNTTIKRANGRKYNQLRPLMLHPNSFGYADGTLLLECGATKVLCTITLQNGVPPFLRGKKTGWLTAEYAMLPTATKTRRTRESSGCKRNGRSVEISRLIGRSLRSVVNLDALGEKTIFVDCDVLQADGSTRTVCITGAYAALQRAVATWSAAGLFTENLLHDGVAAVSVGCMQGVALLDLDFAEDSQVDADFNFVLTRSGKIIEIQGTSEGQGISWESFAQMQQLAVEGVENLLAFLDKTEHKEVPKQHSTGPLFSIKNRTVVGS